MLPLVDDEAASADDWEDLLWAFKGAERSCVARNRSWLVWPPFSRSPMTLTTSANLIGLAWVGTATSNNKLAARLAWRKMRLFMWLGHSLCGCFRAQHSP